MSEKGWTPEINSVVIRGERGTFHFPEMKEHEIRQLENSDGRHVALANARRLKACYNACAGIPNPEGIGDLVDAVKILDVMWSNSDGAIVSRKDVWRAIFALRACGIEVE